MLWINNPKTDSTEGNSPNTCLRRTNSPINIYKTVKFHPKFVEFDLI